MKAMATTILGTMFMGLVTVFGGMFSDINTLKASESSTVKMFTIIERRLERIEDKSDKVNDLLLKYTNSKKK